nr:hepatic sodium/bile acid cotransporter-like isoform X1 [Cherax quadricarinatus]XP_053633458.1 hepatic sodium/bile acid cotransporter-like isoform X1 [Cherax quadricarinatus]XP_053633459.1 hepatic sodium/bile acid cotransporter-like isoform X1 [Cherax quadricarinatus]XP_053633460.1 hepatic sodium/bile acid cotransporter-like isoform X1 [Cherax quadricarinatus]XP_053633461.1 hepatic sodium/bile acid cotransporter-like isoform X1 [Cherax quadricarinatus]XP_053633462.1 hepatic sodium/bile acid 
MQLRLMYGALVVWVGMASLASFVTATVREPKVNFYFNNSLISIIDLKEGEEKQVTFYINDLPSQVFGDLLIKDESDGYLNHLMIAPSKISLNTSINKAEDEVSENGIFEGSFNVTGRFLGFTNIKMVLIGGSDNELIVGKPMLVKVQRGERVLDKIFIHVVIALVIVVYINMGCAIDLKVIKDTLRHPVAPAIGLFSQYLFMPLISYAIGYGIFYDTPEMWLGLFLTGCSPGGGGSNMWTYLLGGSLDLSVTMTFISTVGAFAALPLWVYALARTIFHDGHFSQLPYKNIAMLVVGLVLPLSIGLLIKRWSQRVADVLKRLLKPISIIFIIFIMTFGVYANFYIFAFFNWRVAVAGVLLPWLGFLFGAVASLVCRRNVEELIAISIETGVQNTGLSIGILKVALKEYAPLGDITIVIPIAVATMTPIPLTIAYIIKRILACTMKSRKLEFGHLYNTRNDTPMSASNSNTPLQ